MPWEQPAFRCTHLLQFYVAEHLYQTKLSVAAAVFDTMNMQTLHAVINGPSHNYLHDILWYATFIDNTHLWLIYSRSGFSADRKQNVLGFVK